MTLRVVNVALLPDTIVESNEIFDLTLNVPSLFNGRLSAGDQVAAVGIINDPTSKCMLIYANSLTIDYVYNILTTYVCMIYIYVCVSLTFIGCVVDEDCTAVSVVVVCIIWLLAQCNL